MCSWLTCVYAFITTVLKDQLIPLLVQIWASEVSIGLLVVAFATNVLYTGFTRVHHHLLVQHSCVLLLPSFCAMASCQFTVFNVLLLLMMYCSAAGQQCSPASNSQGMIIPTADLPSEGSPRVYTMYNTHLYICMFTCRSEAVFSGGRGGYTKLHDAQC